MYDCFLIVKYYMPFKRNLSAYKNCGKRNKTSFKCGLFII